MSCTGHHRRTFEILNQKLQRSCSATLQCNTICAVTAASYFGLLYMSQRLITVLATSKAAYILRPLEHWHRGFEPYSGHGYVRVSLCCVLLHRYRPWDEPIPRPTSPAKYLKGVLINDS